MHLERFRFLAGRMKSYWEIILIMWVELLVIEITKLTIQCDFKEYFGHSSQMPPLVRKVRSLKVT